MNTGKNAHLRRLFAHPSGRLCSVAVDHFIGYSEGLPRGLRRIQETLAAVVEARPDAVTMHKGIAASAWTPHAGIVPHILQTTIARVDDSACEQIGTAEDAVRLGADAVAAAAFLKGSTEAAHLRALADVVRDAARFDLPVIFHVYPRDLQGVARVSYDPEDIAWAVRCAVEVGADIVKVPYCGERQAFTQIVADCPVPLVAAGGPAAPRLIDALTMIDAVVECGGLGATIGRNIWGSDQIGNTIRAFKAVIHDRLSPLDALRAAGFEDRAATRAAAGYP